MSDRYRNCDGLSRGNSPFVSGDVAPIQDGSLSTIGMFGSGTIRDELEQGIRIEPQIICGSDCSSLRKVQYGPGIDEVLLSRSMKFDKVEHNGVVHRWVLERPM